jgi:hypothetical protein
MKDEKKSTPKIGLTLSIGIKIFFEEKEASFQVPLKVTSMPHTH